MKAYSRMLCLLLAVILAGIGVFLYLTSTFRGRPVGLTTIASAALLSIPEPDRSCSASALRSRLCSRAVYVCL